MRERPDAVAVVVAEAAALDPELDQLPRLAHGEQPEEDLIDEREHRRVRPDPEGQGEDGDAGEEGGLTEGPEGKADFVHGS